MNSLCTEAKMLFIDHGTISLVVCQIQIVAHRPAPAQGYLAPTRRLESMRSPSLRRPSLRIVVRNDSRWQIIDHRICRTDCQQGNPRAMAPTRLDSLTDSRQHLAKSETSFTLYAVAHSTSVLCQSRSNRDVRTSSVIPMHPRAASDTHPPVQCPGSACEQLAATVVGPTS
jgi:hypothetical protein